jgi:hypothetical protein
LRAGIVVYAGARTLPFGERLHAMPLCGLWDDTVAPRGAT